LTLLGHLGIQYLKAHGYKVIGIDLSPEALEEAKAQGADHVFNPKNDKDYVQQIKSITGKGCHAAINFTNSAPAYASTPDVIRYNGVLMVTGIPQKPIQFSGMDVSMLRIRVRGANNGRTDQLRDCLAFSHKHGIKPHMTTYKLDDFQNMLDTMHAGQHKGRMGVLFD
jgi:propanol-preferring alcohol dehydrogenase